MPVRTRSSANARTRAKRGSSKGSSLAALPRATKQELVPLRRSRRLEQRKRVQAQGEDYKDESSSDDSDDYFVPKRRSAKPAVIRKRTANSKAKASERTQATGYRLRSRTTASRATFSSTTSRHSESSSASGRVVTRSKAASRSSASKIGSGRQSPKRGLAKDESTEMHTPPSKRRRSRARVGARKQSSDDGSAEDCPESPSKMLAFDMSMLTVAADSEDSDSECDSAPRRSQRPAQSRRRAPPRSVRSTASRKKHVSSTTVGTDDDAKTESDSEFDSGWAKGRRVAAGRRKKTPLSAAENRRRILKIQKGLLTSNATHSLKGRDREYRTIFNFFMNALKTRTGDCFYLCGSPGTGKTATMLCIERELMRQRATIDVTLVKLNAMTLETPQSVYISLYAAVAESLRRSGELQLLAGSKSSSGGRRRGGFQTKDAFEAKKQLDALFVTSSKSRKMFAVIIDEMDGLLSKSALVLYQLFEWSKRANSRVALLGIANSIDLTDRFLPRLRVRKVEPQLLIFEPYSKEQLVAIIKHRLFALAKDYGYDEYNTLPYFEEVAVKLCASKVAKTYGDVRKCLEICRAALRLLLVGDGADDTHASKRSAPAKVGFKEMHAVIRQTFASPMVTQIQGLPNKQKIVAAVCCLLLAGIKRQRAEKLKEMRRQLEADFKNSEKQAIIETKAKTKRSRAMLAAAKTKTVVKASTAASSVTVSRGGRLSIAPVCMTFDKLERYYNYLCYEYSMSHASSAGEFQVIVNSLISSGILAAKLSSAKRSQMTMIRSQSSIASRVLTPDTELDVSAPVHEMELACEGHYALNQLFQAPPKIPVRFQ